MSCGNSVDLVAGSHYMEAEISKYSKSRRAHNRQNYSRDKPSSSLVMRQEHIFPANSSSSKQAAEIGLQQMVVGRSAHISPKLKTIIPSKQSVNFNENVVINSFNRSSLLRASKQLKQHEYLHIICLD